MVEVFCGVPDFLVFWSVAFPLGSIWKRGVLESRVDDFVALVFVFPFYLYRRREFLDL